MPDTQRPFGALKLQKLHSNSNFFKLKFQMASWRKRICLRSDEETCEWFYVDSQSGKSMGPLFKHELLSRFHHQALTENTYCWKESFGNQWCKFKKIPELASAVVKVEQVVPESVEKATSLAEQFGGYIAAVDEFKQIYLDQHRQQVEAEINRVFDKVGLLLQAYREQLLDKFRTHMSNKLVHVLDSKKQEKLVQQADCLRDKMEAVKRGESEDGMEQLVEYFKKELEKTNPDKIINEFVRNNRRLRLVSLSEEAIASGIVKMTYLQAEEVEISHYKVLQDNPQEEEDYRNSPPPLEKANPSVETSKQGESGIEEGPVPAECLVKYCVGNFIRSFQVSRKGKKSKERCLSPRALAYNKDTRMLYVADHENHRISIFGSGGLLEFTFGMGYPKLYSRNFSEDSSRAFEANVPDGQLIHPMDIRLWKEQVFVLDKRRIQAYSNSGIFLKYIELPRIGVFESFCIADSNTFLYVTNMQSHRIHVFNQEGKPQRSIEIDLDSPRFIRYFEGKLYVADGSNGIPKRISVLDLSGKLIFRLMLKDLVDRFTRITG